MSRGKVHGVLGLALFATLLAAYFAPAPAEDGVALSERAQTATDRSAPAPGSTMTHGAISPQPVDVLSIRPRETEDETDRAVGVFTVAQWTPPLPSAGAPAAAPVATAPAPPQAPPLPFRGLGRYVDDGKTAVFLQYNDQNLVVRVGDTVAVHYKVESLNGSTLSLRYIPLNLQQTLNAGGGN